MKWLILLLVLVLLSIVYKLISMWASTSKNGSSNSSIAIERTFSIGKPLIDNIRFDYVHQIKIEDPIDTSQQITIENAPTDKNIEHYLEPYLNKLYIWTSFDNNFDDSLRAVGVTEGWKRMLAKNSYYAEKLVKEEGGGYNLMGFSIASTYDKRFKLGEETTYDTVEGRTVKSIFTVNKNVLKEEQRWKVKGKERTATVERKFTGDKMKATMKVDGIISVSEYEWSKNKC